jgi:hypothetical protein
MQPTPSDKLEHKGQIPEWLEIVHHKASALRFGSIQITIHEGRVTQVESLEKTRFQAQSDQTTTRQPGSQRA